MASGLGSPPDSNGGARPRPLKLSSAKVATPRVLNSSAHRSSRAPRPTVPCTRMTTGTRPVACGGSLRSPQIVARLPCLSPRRNWRSFSVVVAKAMRPVGPELRVVTGIVSARAGAARKTSATTATTRMRIRLRAHRRCGSNNMLGRSLSLDEQKKRTVPVLGGCGNLLHELIVASILSPLEIPEADIRNVVEVVGDGVACCPQAILGPALLEVGFDATPGQFGMERGEHKTPAGAQRRERLGEEPSDVRQVFRDQSRQHGIEGSEPDGE